MSTLVQQFIRMIALYEDANGSGLTANQLDAVADRLDRETGKLTEPTEDQLDAAADAVWSAFNDLIEARSKRYVAGFVKNLPDYLQEEIVAYVGDVE